MSDLIFQFLAQHFADLIREARLGVGPLHGATRHRPVFQVRRQRHGPLNDPDFEFQKSNN